MLHNKAYLEVDFPGDRTYTFEFGDAFEESRSGQRSYVIAERGQILTELYDHGTQNLPGRESPRRIGYHWDLGGGNWNREASWQTGAENENIQWGDGSSNASDPDDVTKHDASGAGVSRFDRADVFMFVMARATTDSGNAGRLHYGQWSDGTYGEAGVFERPMPVAVNEWTVSTDTDDPSAITGTLAMTHTALTPGAHDTQTREFLNDVLDFG